MDVKVEHLYIMTILRCNNNTHTVGSNWNSETVTDDVLIILKMV